MKYKMETTFSFLRGLLLLAAVGLCTAQTGAQNNDSTKVDESRIFEVVEKSPQFPGGDEALIQWLGQNIQYPASCQEQNIQGRVFASFIVEKDGSITNAKILRSPHPDFSAEVLRLIGEMPRWTPGVQGGQPVRVKFSLPILFRLDAVNAAAKNYLAYAQLLNQNGQLEEWVNDEQMNQNMQKAYANYIKQLPASTLPPIAETDINTVANSAIEEYGRTQYKKDIWACAASFLQKNYTEEQIIRHIKLGEAKKKVLLKTRNIGRIPEDQKKMQKAFLTPLKNIAKGKTENTKPLTESSCPDSYRTAFAMFWGNKGVREYFKDKLTRGLQTDIHNLSLKAKQQDARENMMAYCEENAATFWRNLIAKRIAEEDLRLFDPHLSDIPVELTKEQQDSLHQELLEKFINWNDQMLADNRTGYISIILSSLELDFDTVPEDSIYKGEPDIQPSFPGGKDALLQWLAKTVKYPCICQEQGIQGRVIASLVVDLDGSLHNIKIVKSPDPAMSKETRRVLRAMPKWTPAMLNGKPVRVKIGVPILFRLN